MVKYQTFVAMFGQRQESLLRSLKSCVLNTILEVPVIAIGQRKHKNIKFCKEKIVFYLPMVCLFYTKI